MASQHPVFTEQDIARSLQELGHGAVSDDRLQRLTQGTISSLCCACVCVRVCVCARVCVCVVCVYACTYRCDHNKYNNSPATSAKHVPYRLLLKPSSNESRTFRIIKLLISHPCTSSRGFTTRQYAHYLDCTGYTAACGTVSSRRYL